MDEEKNTYTEELTEIIGVRFRNNSKVYYFDACGKKASEDENVIVETARGLEFGEVAEANHMVPEKDIVAPLRPVIRIATDEDARVNAENIEKEKKAVDICNRKIVEHGLDMKLIRAEYTFDNSKLIFYFSAEARVDFRELVKDLASTYRTRIELRQIGIRDEAKMIGGLGICGRPFCCSSFLSDFGQVSIKMAKDQNLSLNSVKISGACGRLMCCLRYEYESYERELEVTPRTGETVITPQGRGEVVDANCLTGLVKVRLTDDRGDNIKVFDRDDLKRKQN